MLGAIALYGYQGIGSRVSINFILIAWLILATTQTYKSGIEEIQMGKKVNFSWVALNVGLWLIIGGPMLALIVGIFLAIFDLFAFVVSLPATQSPDIVSVALVFLMGVVLFQIRQHCRYFYGAAEILVGLLIAYYKYPFEVSANYYLAALAGSVYLMVRGMDNMQQGKSTDKILIRMRKIAGQEI